MYAVTNVEGIGQATGSRRNLRQPLREPQPGHQLLVWCVILQLVAGMTEQLEIGNITASALRPWDHMIDGQISRLEVVVASGAISTLPSVQDLMVHTLPRVFLQSACGFTRQVVCDESQSWGRCLRSQYHRYVD